MTASNAAVSAKDGTGATLNMTFAAESFSTRNAQKTYLGSPSSEALVEPAQNLAIANPTSVLTRPANLIAYPQNTLIASSATAGAIVVPSISAARVAAGSFMLRRLRLVTNVTTGWANVPVSIGLWLAAPTYTNGDGGAYAVAIGAANFLGSFNLTLSQFGDGAVGVAAPAVGPDIGVSLASGVNIFWDMQMTNISSVTPISGQTFTLTAEVYQS